MKITRFKTNVSADVTQRLRKGEVLTQLFTQDYNNPYPLAKQIILLYAFNRQVLSALISGEVDRFKQNIYEFIENTSPGLIEDIAQQKDLTASIRKGLDECFVAFFRERDKGTI